MAKTKEELNELKQEFETLNNKLKELSEDEIKQVTAALAYDFYGGTNQDISTPQHHEINIRGLETIGPYALGSIPLDSDSKIKS